MKFNFSFVTNWFKNLFNSKRRAKLWHFFPVGNDLNIKSMLEIIVYLAIIIGGFYLYISFNKVETESYKIQVENLLSKDTTHIDNSGIINDTILSHIANVKFYMPYKYDYNNRARPIFLSNNILFLEKDTSELCHGHIFFGFWSEHSIWRTKDQMIMDYRFNDNIYISNNYHGLRRYIDKRFPMESFKDEVWLDSLCAYNIHEIINNLNHVTNNLDTITELEQAVKEFVNIHNNIQQGYGSFSFWNNVKNNYQEGNDIDPFFSKDDYIYKLFKENNKSYNQNHNLILLRDYFLNKLKDSIGEDKYLSLKDDDKYPINY